MSQDEQAKDRVTAEDLEEEREEQAPDEGAEPWAKSSGGRDPDE
jgi:hypothetical protein